MYINRNTVGWLVVLLLLIGTEACRYPRCPIDSCHIRMRHRHPSFTNSGGGGGESVTMVDVNADPNANLGKVYRGVPWWDRNKDPKIAEKYNPKYKYKHKDSKPWSARILKYKSKRAKKVADDERKAAKQGAKDGESTEGEDTLTEDGMPPQPEGVDLNADPADGSEMTNTEKKKSKKVKTPKVKKPKAPKTPKAPKEKKPKKETPPEEEEKEDDGF